MFITKMALPRRTVLRGMGATLALPFLEAMVPALTATAQTVANRPRRFGVVFVPLGERPGYWTPKTVGPDFEFTQILKPIEKFRQHVTVVSELCDPLDGHATTVSAWLSGAIPKKTFAEDVYSGETVDQVIARKIGQETPLPSLELATEDFTGYVGGCDTQYSCAYMNTISWSSATSPVPMEINPRVVFERLFGRPGTRAQRQQRQRGALRAGVGRARHDRDLEHDAAPGEDLRQRGDRAGTLLPERRAVRALVQGQEGQIPGPARGHTAAPLSGCWWLVAGC